MEEYAPSPHLWEPQRRGVLETIDLLNQGKDVCLYGPTGSGKTLQAIELFLWAQSLGGKRCAFYVNRKLLVGQTSARFGDAGLDHGVRAADFDDLRDEQASVQICSSDTEIARVYRSGIWPLFRADLVVVDEARIQKGAKMGRILEDMPLHEGGWFQKIHSLPAEDLCMD